MDTDQIGGDTEIALIIWPETFADAASWANTPSGTAIDPNQTQGWTQPPAEDAAASFHTETRMADGTLGILVDPGSMGNLGGGPWTGSVAQAAQQHGRKPSQTKRDRPLRVSGVGNGSQTANYNVTLPVCLEKMDGQFTSGTFETPAITDSHIPGLLGLNSLSSRRAVLDMHTRRLHFLGSGDYRLETAMPQGTESYQLLTAPSGHLLLPCGRYNEFDRQQTNGSFTLDSTTVALLAESSQ